MKFLSLTPLILSLASSSPAGKRVDATAQLDPDVWKATMYLSDTACAGNGNYYTFDGATFGYSDCQNLGADGVKGVKCSYFTNNGKTGPQGCGGRGGGPAAIGVKSLNAACSVYTEPDCRGQSVLYLNTGGNWQCRPSNVKSFQCRTPGRM
ncbi:hypothetical protein F4779DRAFT_283540 [Xylariaceae sp. FL0662B]|nr:hypothetical protein F4779DRAFT_283540 [Xylariaceae sp. FL0662B]